MRKLFVGLLPLFIFQGVRAGEAACPPFASPQDVLNCVRKNHPEVLRADAEAANLDAFDSFARQRPNPEIDAEAVSNSDDDEAALSAEASYLHTFELGGKRDRRRDLAKARREGLLARIQKTREEVTLTAVLNLYRLRHLQAELHAVEEAQNTFGTIIGQYKNRRQLSPEQQVSLNVFLLAQSDYILRRSRLLQEQRALRQYFDLATGADFRAVLKALPPPKTVWPALPASAPALAGAARKEAQAEVARAQAELELANSDATPDLKLGPKAGVESGRGHRNQSLGGVLSMDLPLYQRNQGARALARNEARRSEVSLAQRERELSAQWTTWLDVYQDAVASLRGMPTLEQMEKKHQGMESLFERGLVQSALIIEAHRQMTDFTESLNAQELRALEALWSVYVLQGRALEEGI
jgi:cobalt-zinc-cadmium efflux system outer membrane protein